MFNHRPAHTFSLQLGVCLLACILLTACTAPGTQPPPPPESLAEEIVFYDWEGDMPQAVLDAFTQEYGIKVNYLVYESQEDAIANMEAGHVYDVVVMESRFIPLLAKENLLSELDARNLPNAKNVSPNFRELAYDAGNRYSLPYNWGTTGLVVRTDLVEQPVTHWADLWDPRYAGRIGLWMGQHRELISIALKSMGYSANSENPAELEKALERLVALKPNAITLEDYEAYSSAGLLRSGKVILAMGYAADVLYGNENHPEIQYILPEEGALLWNDTFVIPSNSSRHTAAELFLNFVMRPEVNAKIANENLYATPNESAYPFIDPGILKNPVIFPPDEKLVHSELILPLSPAGQQLYDEIWKRFLTAR